jgi:hypothetical protein
MAVPGIGFGGVGLFFEEYGRGFPIIFIQESEVDLRAREAAVSWRSFASRWFETKHAIDLLSAAAFIARFELMLSPVARASWNRADLESDPNPATENLRATLLRSGGEHP